VLLIAALAIKVQDGGPVIFRQKRIGRGRKPFTMYKLRTMVVDAEARLAELQHHNERQGGPLFKLDKDPRVTRVGSLLRATSIDELPQLWNVLCGQMSLVGPRPEDPRFVALHPDGYARILRVRPGITGWSQLAFADERRILGHTDPLDRYVERILPAKVHLDCRYAESARLRHDLAVLLWTAVVLVTRIEVAVDRRTGRLGRRRRRGHRAAGPRRRP
jgi:lipopolysaccharide/colanic/teichoic acid biosynthesis glycosyltransferase